MLLNIINQNVRNAMVCIFSFFFLPFLAANTIQNKNSYNKHNNCNFFTNGENYCLSKYLNKDTKIIFDVGANIGGWTLMALSYAPTSKIYSFEPHPRIYDLLIDNVQSESCKNIICLPFGLSDQEATRDFWVWGNDTNLQKSGLNGLFYRPILKKMFNQNPEKIQIHVVSLDDFCEKNSIEHIDYLKIDTEGNEYFVLLGAEKMISNHRVDCIQFEYGGCYIDSKTDLESVYSFLIERGYDVFRILPKKLLPISIWSSELENFQYSNYLAICRH